MKTKFTKWKWETIDKATFDSYKNVWSKALYIDGFNFCMYISGRTEEEVNANAKLIAAAPDLLAACICESILDKCERNKVIYELQQYGYKGLELPQQFVDRLRIQAIKKATE